MTFCTPPDSVILKICTVCRDIERHDAMRHVVHMLLSGFRKRGGAGDQRKIAVNRARKKDISRSSSSCGSFGRRFDDTQASTSFRVIVNVGGRANV